MHGAPGAKKGPGQQKEGGCSKKGGAAIKKGGAEQLSSAFQCLLAGCSGARWGSVVAEQFSAFWMVSRQSFVSSCPKEQRGKEECHLRCVCVFLPSALCLSAGCAPAGRHRGSGLFDAGCWCIPELCLWACQGAHCSAPYPLLWLNSPPRLVFLCLAPAEIRAGSLCSPQPPRADASTVVGAPA